MCLREEGGAARSLAVPMSQSNYERVKASAGRGANINKYVGHATPPPTHTATLRSPPSIYTTCHHQVPLPLPPLTRSAPLPLLPTTPLY